MPGLPLEPRCATEHSLGHNVATRDEVDAVMSQAAAAGGTIVKPAGETFWGGYAGYFQDPDGHLWEAAWNPQLLPGEECIDGCSGIIFRPTPNGCRCIAVE